jgi:hypothetical protein
MRVKCAECGHLFVGDEAEHENKNKNEIISSKMREFGKGFTIPDDK